MIERSGAWWRAAVAGAMLASASLGACSGVVTHAPSDAAVSDLVLIDMPPVVDASAVDTPPAVDAPVVDTPPAVDTPLICDAGTIRCGATCADTATEVSHCGACNRACEAGWSCVMGTCACVTGQHPVGTVCVADDAPRPLAPVSLGDVTQRRPTFRWALPPGIDGAVVELCRDRACMSVLETLRVTGTSARPTADLPARSTVFWRMRGRAGTAERIGASPTWIFHVPATSASTTVDTSFNPHFDVNGDGYADVFVGAYLANPGRRSFASTALILDRLLGRQCPHPICRFSRANLSPSIPATPFGPPCSTWERWTCATVDSQHARLPRNAFTRPSTGALVVDRLHDRSPPRVRPSYS